MSTQHQPRQTALLVTLIICGTALVLMPQIHASVVSANALYAVAIQPEFLEDDALALEQSLIGVASWMSYLSLGIGAASILVGAGLGIGTGLRTLRA
jgi:hypothetical protein